MSARWRRNRKPRKRFNVVARRSGTREKNFSRIFRVKNPKGKWRAYPYKYLAPKSLAVKEYKWMEPLIDVLEDKDEIVVVAGLAGFKREDLKIRAEHKQLILSAEAVDRKYHKSLNLPEKVVPTTMRTTYKNGVLEIRLKRAVEEKPIDKLAG
ncbi:MAG: Hsp20/alpha crystallin family protein [Candidatus Bathyarchaeales archaeon]